MTIEDIIRNALIYKRTMKIMDRLYPFPMMYNHPHPYPSKENVKLHFAEMERTSQVRKCRKVMFPIIHKRIAEKVEARS